ncbi:MAG: M20/M25/M40 family metallo-hydrolase [Halioglobus sp.]|nr:M20/M25/M40 family metallo-hydrolase [Halioglobus sp.]
MADEQDVTASMLRDKALDSNRGWEIVESLTTEVGPRLAGTEADRRAVTWARALLEQSTEAGLFDRVWLEPVSFPIWQRHRERARVVSPYPQPLQITALGYSGSTDGEISAEVIAFPDLAALQAVDEAAVAGKIVFINQPMARHREGKGYAEVVPNRYAAGTIAKQKGAVAALIRSVGTDSHRFPHAGASSRESDPLPAAALSAPDADQLQRILDREQTLLLALDISVSEQPHGESHNVIAQIDGRADAQKIVLIAAHLDSWDLGTGAIDDGAGVAITVAAAELIGELPQRPKYSVRVVLFANEEQGIWGGKAYAAAHQAELRDHLFASESDFGAGPVWRFNTANEALMDKAMPHLAALGIERGGEAASGGPDIKPLLAAGVPVFRLQQDGTDYFDYHHTADDTLDKIDAVELKQNIAAWAVVTFLAADSD